MKEINIIEKKIKKGIETDSKMIIINPNAEKGVGN